MKKLEKVLKKYGGFLRTDRILEERFRETEKAVERASNAVFALSNREVEQICRGLDCAGSRKVV